MIKDVKCIANASCASVMLCCLYCLSFNFTVSLFILFSKQQYCFAFLFEPIFPSLFWSFVYFWRARGPRFVSEGAKISFPAFPGRILSPWFPQCCHSWSWATSCGHFQPSSSPSLLFIPEINVFPKVGGGWGVCVWNVSRGKDVFCVPFPSDVLLAGVL